MYMQIEKVGLNEQYYRELTERYKFAMLDNVTVNTQEYNFSETNYVHRIDLRRMAAHALIEHLG